MKAQVVFKSLLDSDNKLISEIASFVGVSSSRVEGWYKQAFTPQGFFKLKLLFFLEEKASEQIDELVSLDDDVYKLGKLLSFNVLSLEEVSRDLGVCEENVRKWFLGYWKPMADRKEKIRELIAKSVVAQDFFQKKLPSIPKENVTLSYDEQIRVLKVSRFPSLPTLDSADTKAKKGVIVTLAALIKSALPLVRLLDSDLFSDDDREELRRQIGLENYFLFNGSIMSLSSQKARDLSKR